MDSWNSSKINTAIRMRHSRDSDQRAGWHLATSLGWVVCQTIYISPHTDPVSNPTCCIDFWNCSNYPLAASSGLQLAWSSYSHHIVIIHHSVPCTLLMI